MNIIETIKKVVKTAVGFVKDIIGMLKASFEIKKAKVKAWHEYKKITNADYFEGIVSVITGLVRIFVPVQLVVAIIRVLIEGWHELV